jgi:hypothetical protein
MSNFNMVAGTNKLAGLVLHALSLEHTQVPRFRDAYLNLDEPDHPKLVILTRTGGGNRPHYVEENKTLSGLAGFICDHDDPFDTTFAHWVFDIPEDVPPVVTSTITKIIEMAHDPESGLDPEVLMKPMDRFRSRLERGAWDPSPMAEQMKEIFRKAGWTKED